MCMNPKVLLAAFGKIPILRVLRVGPRSAFEEMKAAIEEWKP